MWLKEAKGKKVQLPIHNIECYLPDTVRDPSTQYSFGQTFFRKGYLTFGIITGVLFLEDNDKVTLKFEDLVA